MPTRPMPMQIVATAAATLALGATAAAAQDEVRVFNWSDYIAEDLLTQFEEETGIDLTYDVYDSNEVLETRLLAGQTGYDVVVPTGTFLARQIEAGVYQELNYDLLPNAQYLWDRIRERAAVYDPGNEYSVNYMWGTTGIGADEARVTEILGDDAPLDSLDLVFDPENMEQLAECGVMFLDTPQEILPAALTYLGEDPDSKDPEVIERAVDEVLRPIRPYVQNFHSSEYINALATGEVCVAFGWSGDILQARDRAAEAENGIDIVYNPPVEGALMWFDQMAIPADAPNPEAAHAFINFMMDPQNMAEASNYVYFANGNEASQEYLNEDVINDPAIYPPEETLENLYTVTPYDPRIQRTITRLWTSLKSGT